MVIITSIFATNIASVKSALDIILHFDFFKLTKPAIKSYLLRVYLLWVPWVTLHYIGLLLFVAMSAKEADENIAMVIITSIFAANIASVKSALDIILYFDFLKLTKPAFKSYLLWLYLTWLPLVMLQQINLNNF